MSFQTQIDSDIKDAMRARDTVKLGVLRMLKAALMNAAIEKLGAGGQLEDVEAMAIVRKEIKKRHDAVEGFEKGGRAESAANEKAEIEILNTYLPQALGNAEIEALVLSAIAEAGATSKQQMGAVMKIATAKAAGSIDGKTLSAEVQKRLA